MSVDERLVARLRGANPEPNDATTPDTALVALLDNVDLRSQNMTTTETKTLSGPSQPPTRKRGLLMAAAAFAAVLLIGAALFLVNPTDDPPVVDQPSTDADAIELVQDLASALSGDGALPPIGPDVTVDEDPLPAYLDFATTLRTRVTLTGCGVESGVIVSCRGTRTNVVLETMQSEETGTWTFFVQDGVITQLSRALDAEGAIVYFTESGPSVAFEEDYTLWLDERHPEWVESATVIAGGLVFDGATAEVMLEFLTEYATDKLLLFKTHT